MIYQHIRSTVYRQTLYYTKLPFLANARAVDFPRPLLDPVTI